MSNKNNKIFSPTEVIKGVPYDLTKPGAFCRPFKFSLTALALVHVSSNDLKECI